MLAASQPSHDRNLLFGMLALQLDFITRDQLIDALHAWVLAKQKPLAQLLTERGSLAASRCALLEALVNEHLAQHQDDPQQSLASLSSVGSVREALAQIHDEDVQASLRHVSASRPAPTEDPHSTQDHLSPPTVPVRYLMLRPHAKGGLGEVFVAQDQELHREVALKEIQDHHADDPDSRARFVLEAEITGGLEHPGIVPVYGLGTYADGRPYYAMRFIKGDSLKDAIKRFHEPGVASRAPGERTLELRRLLGRFIDVCNALAYAHSRGVLHRDLKPGNIMLGKYGETLVVDWGLAKTLGQAEPGTGSERPLTPAAGQGATPTVMGSLIGTPAYMSPEQAAGRLDLLGPASDIYSLGATLYHLLTGKPPVTGRDTGEIASKVVRGDIVPPRQANAQTPPALAAVCLKAMALQPENRYESALALAADVEHWLAEEPVSAWPEPLSVRAYRWVKRHRTAVTSAVAAVTVAAVALAATAVLLTVAYESEFDARKKEADAREAAEKAVIAEKAATSKAFAAAKAEKDAREAADRSAFKEKLATKKALAAAKAEKEARDVADVATAAEKLATKKALDALSQEKRMNAILESIFRKIAKPRSSWGPNDGFKDLTKEMTAKLEQIAESLDYWASKTDMPQILHEALYVIGQDLLKNHMHSLAEPILGESLAIAVMFRGTVDESYIPLEKAMLGACLLAQKKYGSAAPLLKESYDGLTKLEKWLSPEAKETLERLVQLNDATGNTGEADRWRLELAAYTKPGRSAETTKLGQILLADARKTLPKESPHLAGALAQVGFTLLQLQAHADAELLLRECLAIRVKAEPNLWTTFNTQSMLGASLLGQKQFADAEPLLLKGYEGMYARVQTIPPQSQVCLTEALERLVNLYHHHRWERPDRAALWRKKLDARKKT